MPHAAVEPMPVAAPAEVQPRERAPVRVTRGTRTSAAALAAGVALVAAAATLPWWAPAEHASSWMHNFVEIACYFVFAMMWNLLAGYGGMVSIGQQAYFGLGGGVRHG